MMLVRSRNHKGAVMVEMALVLPIFLMLIFAMIEIGWLFHTRLTMSAAAQVGARVLAIKQASLSDAELAAVNYLDDMGFSSSNFSVYAEDTDPNCIRSKPTVSLSVETRVDKVSLIGDPFNILTSLNHMKVRSTLRKECFRGAS